MTEFEIAKLRLAPSDVLVVRVDDYISEDVHRRIAEHIKSAVPDGVKVLILDKAISVSVLTRSEIEAKAA